MALIRFAGRPAHVRTGAARLLAPASAEDLSEFRVRQRAEVAARLRRSLERGREFTLAESDTVTMSFVEDTPTITGGGVTVIPRGSPLVRRLSGKWVRGATYPGDLVDYPRNTTNPAFGVGGLNPMFEVRLIGDSFEFLTLGGEPGDWAIQIDGLLSNADGYTGPVGDGSIYYNKFVLPAGGGLARRVRVHLTAGTTLGEIRLPSGASLVDPTPAVPSTAVFIGDSITENTGASAPRKGWASQCAARLGLDDWAVSGVGATGYLADASGARYTFRERPDDVLRAFNGGPPDLCIVAGGINDPVDGLEDEARLYFQQLRDGAPAMTIVVLGPFNGNNPSYGGADKLAALESAAADVERITVIDIADWYADPDLPDWFDVGDNTHPIDLGHYAYGEKGAAAIAPVIRALAA